MMTSQLYLRFKKPNQPHQKKHNKKADDNSSLPYALFSVLKIMIS